MQPSLLLAEEVRRQWDMSRIIWFQFPSLLLLLPTFFFKGKPPLIFIFLFLEPLLICGLCTQFGWEQKRAGLWGQWKRVFFGWQPPSFGVWDLIGEPGSQNRQLLLSKRAAASVNWLVCAEHLAVVCDLKTWCCFL